jgi:hypothetical protein
LFFRSLYFRPGDLLPAFNLQSGDRDLILGTNVFPEGTYFDLVQKGRMLRGEYKFAWAASFNSGSSATAKELRAGDTTYSDGLRRFYIVAGMIAGFNGFNHYMFVDRDHWYGAPLANDGTITSGYEVIRNLNTAIQNLKMSDVNRQCKICVLGNRYYQWMQLLNETKQFTYIESLLRDAIGGVCRDFMRLKLDYDIRETLDPVQLKKYKLVVMPVAEFMPESQQEMIIELLKGGVNVVLCGLIPKYDEDFKDCQVLSRHLRIKTTLGMNIDTIKLKNSNFTAQLYGHILTTDNKVKKLATMSRKAVGVASSRYRGSLYLFTFDIGSNGDHNKLVYLEQLLAENGLVSHMYCSDPSVDMIIQTHGKKAVLFMAAPPAGELAALSDTTSREVVIRVNLRKAGIASARIKMVNLLAGEEAEPIKITSDNLRKGLALPVDFPDGAIYMIEKR